MPGRLADPRTRSDDVRLGPDPVGLSRDRQPRLFEALTRAGQCGGVTGDRLWRIWRGVRAHRPRREPTTPAPGDAQYQDLPLRPQRRRRATPRRTHARRGWVLREGSTGDLAFRHSAIRI